MKVDEQIGHAFPCSTNNREVDLAVPLYPKDMETGNVPGKVPHEGVF
jgi:hypothetical protein